MVNTDFLDALASKAPTPGGGGASAYAGALAKLEPLGPAERTVAILARSNWQVERIVRGAKERGLNVETNASGDLFCLESTLDLYRLVEALLDNTNPIALANLIESSYTDLRIDYTCYRKVPRRRQAEDMTRVLDEFFSLRTGSPWRQAVEEAASMPALPTLRHLFSDLQPWRQCSDNPRLQRKYATNYEYLIELLAGGLGDRNPSLGRIADYLRVNISTNHDQPSRDAEPQGDGVRLLCTTVHRSKGLEYGTVILPYTHDDMARAGAQRVVADYGGGKLSYLVDFGDGVQECNTNFDEARDCADQVAEEGRILYVALTRAIRNCVWMKDLDHKPARDWASLLEE